MVRRCSSRWWSVFASFFAVIFGVLCWWSFEDDFMGFCGCHVWGSCTSFAGDFPPNLSWIGLDLVVFRVGQVLDLERRFLRFLLIVSNSGRFLLGRGCQRGNPANPEVSLQSVQWFGRSGARKLTFDPRVRFLQGAVWPPGGGRSNCPGPSRSKFCFAGFSSVSLFALIEGASRWNFGLFSCCLLGVLVWSSLLGTGG
jgi:hypothetical protein